MPIVLPIESAGLPVAVVLAGATELTANGTVILGSRVVLAGATELTATGSLLTEASANLEGGTELIATGRLNSEANVFGAAELAGATVLTADSEGLLWGGAVLLDGSTDLVATGTVAIAEEFGFTIFLDILPAGFASSNTRRRYAARLTASGTELPVRSITESAPRGALGVTLSVTLAKPDTSLVSTAADLQLEIGVWNGSAFSWMTVMEGGKLAGRSARYANQNNRPADVVSFTTLDALGDRWTLAPRIPEILYDPDRTDAPSADSRNVVRNDRGAAIVPVVTPIFSLSLHEVLRRAYHDGCGFSEVVTNIPDFPVARAEFTLEGGYHAGVLPLLTLFEPIYFSPDADALWIIDADAPLPAGFAPLVLTAADVESIDDTLPARQSVEALILEYKPGDGDYFTERDLEPEVSESGVFGSPGFTRTETRRRVREYRNLSAPETVVREEDVSVETRTLDQNFEIKGRETQTNSFDTLGRKSSHTLTVEARVPDLEADGALVLQRVSEETYTIRYRQAGAGAIDEIAQTVNEESGLVLIDDDKPYLEAPYEMRYLDAHHSGYIDPDANQTAEFRAIRTVIETYVREGGSVEVRRQVSNHLNGGTIENPSSATRAGSIAINRRSQGTIKTLLTVDGTEESERGRIIPTYNAGDLPGEIALELGRRKLARLNNPPRPLALDVPYIHFGIRRGQIIEVRTRGGVSLGTFIVEEYTRRLAALDSQAQQFSMSVIARQLGGGTS